ncbi:MAG: PAS domain-containing protein [Gammaproteobacteria bacterium]
MQEDKKEKNIKDDDLIVSKTDLDGNITYCNSEFMVYTEQNLEDLIGERHVNLAHSDMPLSLFRYMWKELKVYNEVCTVIKNRTKSGGHFWTFMTTTPTFGVDNQLIGYFFVQRSISAETIAFFESLYKQMKTIELESESDEQGMDASFEMMTNAASKQGEHNEFVYSYYA